MPIKQFTWVLSLLTIPMCGYCGTVPSGTPIELRLRNGIQSYSNHAGDPITASIIAPVIVEGQVLIPPGSTLRGSLTEVRHIGWGFRPNATIRLDFNAVEFPDGTSRELKTRLVMVDNAREKVDETGRIVGIRATSAMGFRLAGITRNIFIWDPLIQGVLAVSTAATLRFPEAEINYTPGTELLVVTEKDLEVDRDWPWSVPPVTTFTEQTRELRTLVRGLTWRTTTEKKLAPADITNVILVGEPEWIERAFQAAGWLQADRLTAGTGWRTFRAVAENGEYKKAPMSGMLLDEQRPLLRYSKALNNYSQRHHLRIWAQSEKWNGRPIFSAASTQDVAITFSFSLRRTIHVIDRNIDNERTKVVNDLVYTGCVDAAELMDRPWVPSSSKGSNGGLIMTDSSVAVLELNPCRSPRMIEPAVLAGKSRPNAWKRGPRNVFLTIGNDFTYNNPVVQAVKGVQFLWNRGRGNEVWPTFYRQSFISKSAVEHVTVPEFIPD